MELQGFKLALSELNISNSANHFNKLHELQSLKQIWIVIIYNSHFTHGKAKSNFINLQIEIALFDKQLKAAFQIYLPLGGVYRVLKIQFMKLSYFVYKDFINLVPPNVVLSHLVMRLLNHLQQYVIV